jgi:hypothetical protein
MTVHHVDVQDVSAASFDGPDFLAEAGKVCRQDRRSDFDISIEHALTRRVCVRYGFLVGFETGVGRGATGRRLSLLLVREFVFAGRFAFVFAFAPRFAFAFAGLLALAFAFGRFALLVVLPFAFSFVFFGLLGRFAFAFAFADALVLRFSLVGSGVGTVSGDSPSFVGRLTSIATV